MTDRGSGSGGDRAPRDDQDLAALVDELSTTLEALRDAADDERRPVRRSSRPPRPFGGRGPTPPTPRELLRFTEQYTIPTFIALLESGVRSLELLRATLRLLDGRGIETASPEARERVESVGRTTLDRVDAVLSDVGSAIEGGEPTDPDARDLLADARALREEIDRRLRETEASERGRERERGDGRDWDGSARRASGRAPATGREIPVRAAEEDESADGEDGENEEDENPPVDVEAELDTIRRDVRGEADEDVPADPGNGSEETDEGGDDGEGRDR